MLIHSPSSPFPFPSSSSVWIVEAKKYQRHSYHRHGHMPMAFLNIQNQNQNQYDQHTNTNNSNSNNRTSNQSQSSSTSAPLNTTSTSSLPLLSFDSSQYQQQHQQQQHQQQHQQHRHIKKMKQIYAMFTNMIMISGIEKRNIGHAHAHVHVHTTRTLLQQQLQQQQQQQQQQKPVHVLQNDDGNENKNNAIHNNDKNNNNNNNNDDNIINSNNSNNNNNNNNAEKVTALHIYHNPVSNITLYGLGLSKPKFKAWIQYKHLPPQEQNHQKHQKHQKHQTEESKKNKGDLNTFITTESIVINNDNRNHHHNNDNNNNNHDTTTNIINNEEQRNMLRAKWFKRQLISDRTEILTCYPSNQVDSVNSDTTASTPTTATTTTTTTTKRGGFHDLLSIYSDRLITIFQDEEELKKRNINHNEKNDNDSGNNNKNKNKNNNGHHSISSSSSSSSCISKSTSTSNEQSLIENNNHTKHNKNSNHNFDLLSWLQNSYGIKETNELHINTFKRKEEKDQMYVLQHFLHWFRDSFPYYYDRCDTCHASYREDENNKQIECDVGASKKSDGDDDNEEEEEIGSFLGYVYPDPNELKGKASRSEIYHCHKCGSYTRFPRYNAISSIVKYGRGRCGEYSILLYRILRDLGHESRWVVDWSDHVWCECRINVSTSNDNHDGIEGGGAERWVHLDPCEAACDLPHLYQDWGKKQTMIVAFWLPPQLPAEEEIRDFLEEEGQRNICPFVEDVTHNYTTDSIQMIEGRRDESSEVIQTAIDRIQAKLRKSVNNLGRE